MFVQTEIQYMPQYRCARFSITLQETDNSSGNHFLRIELWPQLASLVIQGQHARVKDRTGYSWCFEWSSNSSSIDNLAYFSHFPIAYYPARIDQKIMFSYKKLMTQSMNTTRLNVAADRNRSSPEACVRKDTD